MSSPGTRTDWPAGLTQPPTADELPYEDGVPMESPQHREQMNLLIDSLGDFWAERQDFYVGGNMFLYFSLRQVKSNDFRGPDVFVVLNTGRHVRKSWVVWEEDGRVPDVVIQLLSESTADDDRGEKKRVYERMLRVPEYVLFDPMTAEFEAYRLGEAGSGYRSLEANAAGRLPLSTLGLELGLWQGTYHALEGRWLRWFTPAGVLVPTAEERAAGAEARAAELAARIAEYERRFGPLPATGK